VLSVDDAAAFLLERTERRRQKTPDDAATARQLAGDLGQLALALEQAGAYVAKLGISFFRYRELWRDNWDKVAGWSDERITKYPRAVAVTWQTSVNQLTPTGRRLLEWLAWFAPEPIPNFLLEVPVPDVAGDDLADALANLADYSLARRDPDKQEFIVHRLVQEVTRRGLAEQERRRRLVEALAWTDMAFAGDPKDVRTWPSLDPLAPHAKVVIEYADRCEISEPTARLINQLGLLLQMKARYAEAEPLLRRALAIAEAGYGPYHLEVAINLNNLAALLWITNRLSEAEPLYRRALEIFEGSYGPDHPDVAKGFNNLAVLLRSANRPGEAEPLLRQALAISEASYGPDHPEVAIALNNLAALLEETNRLTEAELFYRRALAIAETNYGANHPNVAMPLNNLALVLRVTNRPTEAESLCRRALTIVEKSYGPNHPDVATCLNNLAGLLEETNRLTEAELLYRRALAIAETNYGANHPNVAMPLNNLALLLLATNRLNEAESASRRALEIYETSYGPEHPIVATGLNNFALFLRTANQLSDAEPFFRRALSILTRFRLVTGHQHPNFEVFGANYIFVLRELGRNQAEIEGILKSVFEATRDSPP